MAKSKFRWVPWEERRRNRAKLYAAKWPDGRWCVDASEAATLDDLRLMAQVRKYHPAWIDFARSILATRASDD